MIPHQYDLMMNLSPQIETATRVILAQRYYEVSLK